MSAKQFNKPHINTGLDDSHVVIKYPKDPIEIGKTVVDGNFQPVWVDPKDLIPTPDQKAEQAENMRGQAKMANRQDAEWELLARVEAWFGRCIQDLYPGNDLTDTAAIKAWMQKVDLNYQELPEQHGGIFKFVLRMGQKQLSTFIGVLNQPANGPQVK